MRSILALVLALLILAAEAPGFFAESPVCAAVDGREVAGPERAARGKSCCGTASCPMHARGAAGACPMSGANAVTGVTTGEAQLCVPSCGRGGAQVLPGATDPVTLDRSRTTPALPTAGGAIRPSRHDLPARNPEPSDPPPRA